MCHSCSKSRQAPVVECEPEKQRYEKPKAQEREEATMTNVEGHQQQATKRMRGDGSIYRRGATWWVCYYVDGKQQRESTKTSDEETARKYLRRKLKEAHAHEL